MKNEPQPKLHYTVRRGWVDNLEGSQDYPFFSWLRFDLDCEPVLVHSFFLAPPRLEAGDEVVVAGTFRNDRFDVMACFKPTERDDERDRRRRNERWRQRLWLAIFLLPGLAILAYSLANQQALYRSLLLSFCPAVSFWSMYAAHQTAELELALAVARGSEEVIGAPIPRPNSESVPQRMPGT